MHRLIALIALLAPAVIDAQLPVTAPPKEPASTKPVETDPFGRDTPHGCVLGFLKAADHGDYAQAAEYLDVRTTPEDAHELARQLQDVLNRGLSANLSEISRAAEGDLKDGLRDNLERIGQVETGSGKLEILLVRVQRGGPPMWLFSYDTLRGVPGAFEEINSNRMERFLERVLPGRAREISLFSVPLWRWLLVVLIVGLGLVLASLLTRALIVLLRPALRRFAGLEDDRYLLSLKQPIRLILLALSIRIIGSHGISVLGRNLWVQISYVLAVGGVSWLLILFSAIALDLRSRQLRQRQATGQIAVLILAQRLFKIFVFFAAVVLLLRRGGVNVSAVLTGLGIGGIALALAAQKTLEDLFGGIAIITRKAVRVGDFCQLADQMGTISDIGLASTRIRTLSNTVVTIPNSKVSQMGLENYSMREKIWFHHVFGLSTDTSPAQMRQVLSQVTQMLRGDRRVEKESARIRFLGFDESSLKVEIFAYIRMTDYGAFLEVQEELLLRIMDIIAASGTRVALPSRMTYVEADSRNRGDGRLFPDDRERSRTAGLGKTS